MAQFAREIGVTPCTIYTWKNRFGRTVRRRGAPVDSGPGADRADLVEIEPTSRSASIEITIGAATIRVPHGFDEPTLRRVLGVVRSC